MWILHTLLLIAPVNKYFTQSGGPDASNTEKSPGDLITSSTLSMVTQKQVQLLQRADEKPMEITITHNQNQLLILHLSAIILLLETNQFL
jgi:hypothetical protein